MSIQPLGLMAPTPGTPLQIISKYPVVLRDKHANAVFFQVHPDNQGDVYIGKANLNKASPDTIIAILRPPTANHLPDLVWSIPSSPNPFVLSEYKVDVDQSGDKVRVSFTEW